MTTFLIFHLFFLLNLLITSQAKPDWKNGINVAGLTDAQLDQIRAVPRSHFSIVEDVILPRADLNIPENVQLFTMYFGVDMNRTTVTPNATLGLLFRDYEDEPVLVGVKELIDLTSSFKTDTTEAARSGFVAVSFTPPSLYFVMGQLSNGTYVSRTDWIYRANQEFRIALIPLPGARKGHTALHFFPDPPPSASGVLLILGGMSENDTYHNDMWENYVVAGTVKSNISLPTGPSKRAWHTSLITADGNMFVFGGTDGTQYFNDLWVYNYYSQTWTNLSPTGGPSPRAGQVMLFSYIKNSKPPTYNETCFYIYGGEDGNTVFDDFWLYNISTNSWIDLYDPIIPKPIARAYHAGFSYVGYDSGQSFLIYFGGIDKDRKTSSSFSLVNIDKEFCEISCPYVVQGQCVPFQYCYDYYAPDCSWINTNRFKCGYNCTSSAQNCLAPNNCPGLRCWDGQCTDSYKNCESIPNCDIGKKRCADGRCSTENDNYCTTISSCPSGTTLCANGECLEECYPYSGCLPGDKPVQCGNGLCAAKFSDCNKNCNGTTPLQCIEGCGGSCDPPDWMYTSEAVDVPFYVGPYQGDSGEKKNNYRPWGTPANPELFGFVFNRAVYNYTDAFFLNFHPLSQQDLQSIGPHPYWNADFDPESITVAWRITLTSRDRIKADNVSVDMGILPRSPESLKLRNDTEHVKDYYCIAVPVLWYWDSFDLDNHSQIQNVSYISQFRKLSAEYPAPYGVEGVYEPPGSQNISKPLLRWQCLNDAQFGWPLLVGTNSEGYLRYGIHLTVDTGVYALIYLPSYAFIDQPDPILPKDRPANFAVLAIGAIILFVLILVVGYKVLVQKK